MMQPLLARLQGQRRRPDSRKLLISWRLGAAIVEPSRLRPLSVTGIF